MLTSPWGTQSPPHGWRFRQAVMKWDMPAPVSQTLDSAAQQILKVRVKNPAITAANKLSTNLDSIKDELITYNALLNGVPVSPVLPKSEPRRLLPQVVQDAAAAVKRTAQGSGAILDWLNAGAPSVPQEQANSRAQTCVACPKLDRESGKWFTIPAAELLRKALDKLGRKLETPFDSQLGQCSVCLCPMALKSHMPLYPWIMPKTKPEVYAEFPPNCWIRRENEAQASNHPHSG